MRQTISILDDVTTSVSNRAIIVSCFCTTEYKIKLTLDLLQEIRSRFEDIFIVISSHLPVDVRLQELADYSIYNKNNPIINVDINTPLSAGRFMTNHVYRNTGVNETISRLEQTHSYAHHLSILDGFKICIQNRIEYVHFLNYDVPYSALDVLDDHYSSMKDDRYDGVFYSYCIGLHYSTEFFSMKSLSYDRYLGQILSYEDWTKKDSYLTEDCYKRFLEDADILCLGPWKHDGIWGDVIGECVYGGQGDEVTEVSVMNSVCGNHVIIPYIRDDGTISVNASGPTFQENLNDSDRPGQIKWEAYNESLELLDFSDGSIAKMHWAEYYAPVGTRFIKIYIENVCKAFFDVNDKRNMGIVSR